MIIITGPGRSGTSVVAKLYLELGFDPGGRWNETINAGLEDDAVVRMNKRLASDLALGVLGPPKEASLPPKPIADLWKRVVPGSVHERVRDFGYRLSGLPNRRSRSTRWDRLSEVVEKHRAALQEIARTHRVVKDPRFSWTLAVWAAAGAEIEHVVVCVRSLDAMVRSRTAAGHGRGRTSDSARDSFAYGLGLCMSVIYEYDLPHRVIRFPDFLQQPDDLYEALRFPKPVSRERFLEVFGRAVRWDLVHQQR